MTMDGAIAPEEEDGVGFVRVGRQTHEPAHFRIFLKRFQGLCGRPQPEDGGSAHLVRALNHKLHPAPFVISSEARNLLLPERRQKADSSSLCSSELQKNYKSGEWQDRRLMTLEEANSGHRNVASWHLWKFPIVTAVPLPKRGKCWHDQ